MQWTSLDTWIVITGVLSAASCALLGNLLVLRRLSMMGDAISHAVLPGLAVAFLLTGSRGSVVMLIGAGVVGVMTAALTQWLHQMGRVEPGASMGVVFTVLFAIGLILIVRGADQVDLDPGCVLYGAIELVPLDTVQWLGVAVPRAVTTIVVVLAIDVFFVLLFYKELKVCAFDPALATSLGINANLMHYLLISLVAMTTVASFESVGSILVIAMLIVPAVTARLLTDRLSVMMALSLVVAGLSAVLGHVGAITVPAWFGYSDTSTAGMMAVAAGGLFVLTLLGAPRHGLLSRLLHRVMLGFRITREDILGLLYRWEELQTGRTTPMQESFVLEALGYRRSRTAVALWVLRRYGQVNHTPRGYSLTPAGRDGARNLIRAHRLWESYLCRYLNLPADHVHNPATVLEHITDTGMMQRLADGIGQADHDPQGRRIPPPSPPRQGPPKNRDRNTTTDR